MVELKAFAAAAAIRLTAQLTELGLKELRALAVLTLDGQEKKCVNGERGHFPFDVELSEAAAWMIDKLRLETAYKTDVSVLPFAARVQLLQCGGEGTGDANALAVKQARSLVYHAEKKGRWVGGLGGKHNDSVVRSCKLRALNEPGG